mgnify:CR=1 FL=1
MPDRITSTPRSHRARHFLLLLLEKELGLILANRSPSSKAFERLVEYMIANPSFALTMGGVMLACAVVCLLLATLLREGRISVVFWLIAASVWGMNYWWCQRPVGQLDFRSLGVFLAIVVTFLSIFLSMCFLLIPLIPLPEAKSEVAMDAGDEPKRGKSVKG